MNNQDALDKLYSDTLASATMAAFAFYSIVTWVSIMKFLGDGVLSITWADMSIYTLTWLSAGMTYSVIKHKIAERKILKES